MIGYTKRVLVQRIRKHVAASRSSSDEFAPSDNEILLLIDQAAAAKIVGTAFNGAKVEGAIYIAEAYLITYALPALTRDPANGYWFATLPQPPMSLPLGYSVNRVYFKSTQYGESNDAHPIKAKRVGRRTSMPVMPGIRYWVEGNTIWLASASGASLYQQQCYIQMPSARTQDMDAVMNMPEDDISLIFDTVIKSLMQRYSVPQDIVLDGLSAGNKSS